MENDLSSENFDLRDKIRKLEEENKKLNQLVDKVEEKTKKLSDDFSKKHLYSFTDKGWVDTNRFGDKLEKPKPKPKEEKGIDMNLGLPPKHTEKEREPPVKEEQPPVFEESPSPEPVAPEKLPVEKPLTVEGLNKQIMDIIQLIAKSKSKST